MDPIDCEKKKKEEYDKDILVWQSLTYEDKLKLVESLKSYESV